MLMGLKNLVIVLVVLVFSIFVHAEEYDKTSFYIAYNTKDKTEFALVMPMVNKVYTHKAGKIKAGDLTQIGDQFNTFPTYNNGELCFSELHSSATGEAGASIMAGKCYKVDFFYTQKKVIDKGMVFMLYYKPLNKVYEGLAGQPKSFLIVKNGTQIINKNSITNDDYSYFYFYTSTAIAMLTHTINAVPEKPKLSSVINTAGDGNITVSWEEVSQSTHYNLYWKTENNATWHKIVDVNSSYIHKDTEDNIKYSYYVTALNSRGESNASNIMSVTTRSPKISGTAFSFDSDSNPYSDINGTGIAYVCLLDMNYSIRGTCKYTVKDNTLQIHQSLPFNFEVERNRPYLLTAGLYDGTLVALGRLTPSITADSEQNITFKSDLVFSLLSTNLYYTGKISDDLKLNGLTQKELSTYLEKSKKAVENYMAFVDDRNSTHGADRLVEGLYNMSRDFINARSEFNVTNKAVIRAYGGYIDDDKYTRTLDDILDDPIPPLNPGFLFAAKKSLTSGGSEVVLGFSELDLKRWDFVGKGYMPHINVGGNRMVYQADYYNSTYKTNIGLIYIDTLGESNKKVRISPTDMHCNYPEISPDGKTVAMSCIKLDDSGKSINLMGPENIYTVSVDGTWDYPVDSLKSITSDDHFYEIKNIIYYGNSGPTWSKDGRYIYFTKLTENNESTNFLSVIKRYDTQSKKLEDFISIPNAVLGNDLVISPDMKYAYLSAYSFENKTMDIYKITLDPKAFSIQVIANSSDYSEWFPSISYDGHYIIYTKTGNEKSPSMKLLNRYTLKEVYTINNFANALEYFTPLLTATSFVMVADEKFETDENGVANIDKNDTRTSGFNGMSDHTRIYNEINTILRDVGVTTPYISYW